MSCICFGSGENRISHTRFSEGIRQRILYGNLQESGCLKPLRLKFYEKVEAALLQPLCRTSQIGNLAALPGIKGISQRADAGR